MKVAMFQMPVAASAEENVTAIHNAMVCASGQGADLMLTPELSIPSYRDLVGLACAGLNPPVVGARVGETNSSPNPRHEVPDAVQSDRVLRLRQWCKELHLAIVVGAAEPTTHQQQQQQQSQEQRPLLHNVTLFIDKDGIVQTRYRKSHLYGPHELQCFTPAAGPKFKSDRSSSKNAGDSEKADDEGESCCYPNDTLISFMGFQIAIICCFDVEFPEMVRSCVLKGANFIIAPSAACDDIVHRHMIRIRSYENGIFVAYPNVIGPSELGNLDHKKNDAEPSRDNTTTDNNSNYSPCCFKGGSCITGPDGTDVLRMPFIQQGGLHIPKHHSQWPRRKEKEDEEKKEKEGGAHPLCFRPDIEIESSSRFKESSKDHAGILTGVSDKTLRVVEILGEGFEAATRSIVDENAFLKSRRPELYQNLVA